MIFTADGKPLRANMGFIGGFHLVRNERMEASSIASERIYPEDEDLSDDQKTLRAPHALDPEAN
jgi:hypothetical protein